MDLRPNPKSHFQIDQEPFDDFDKSVDRFHLSKHALDPNNGVFNKFNFRVDAPFR